MPDKFWKTLLPLLPLTPPSDERHGTYAERAELIKQTGCGADAFGIVENIFVKLGLLDAKYIEKGHWAFVSYSATLFARSVVSTLASTDASFFDADFWLKLESEQRSQLLETMEKKRNEGKEISPLRVNIVAWTIVRKGDQVLLCAREINQKDPDSKASGKYVLPGGRVQMNDLEGIFSKEEARDFLFGLPGIPSSTVTDDNKLDQVLQKTLERELQEELSDKLEEVKDYTIEGSRDLEPHRGIYGASDRRVGADTRIRLYFIKLNHSGILKLAQEEKIRNEKFPPEWLWVNKDNPGEETSYGKPFLDAFKNNWKDFSTAKDMEEIFTNKFQSVVLPLNADKPLLCFPNIGSPLEINLPDDESARLLLLLGGLAREFPCTYSDNIKVEPIGWGWVKLNDHFTKVARELDHHLQQKDPEFKLLVFCNEACRLNMPAKEIYFSPELFEGQLSGNPGAYKLHLLRKRLEMPGFCDWQRISMDFNLTETVSLHLANFNNKVKYDEDSLAAALDLLRKSLAIKNTRKLGLRALYVQDGGKYVTTVPLQVSAQGLAYTII